MKPSNPITTLPPSPTDDRHSRMRRYLLATGIRLVCIVFCFVLPLSWWTIIPVIGAVVIPYIAVVLANVGHEAGQDVERPGGIELYRGPQQPWQPEPVQADAPAEPAPRAAPVVPDDDDDDEPVRGADGRFR